MNRFALFALPLLSCACAAGPGGMGAEIAPCPDRPNCVSSLAEEGRHAIDPIAFSGEADQAVSRLAEVIRSMDRAEVIHQDAMGLDATFRSRLFRFVDDVTCRVNPEKGVIEIRSASRTGYSDLGVNRKRVEEIRRRFGLAAP